MALIGRGLLWLPVERRTPPGGFVGDTLAPMTGQRSIQAPKGTRDFYPEEMLRRRYITDAWRRTALRHGFEEIDGPVFEHRELYEKKSGEGILNEMFSVFSGKDPGQREALERGEPAPFGLRPEFTPTLARMYAARARQLPNPCKWFCVSNFFRAERPQRGRLREFFQWNCDVVGEGSPALTHEMLTTIVLCTENLGLTSANVKLHLSDRRVIQAVFDELGIPEEVHGELFNLFDRRGKLSQAEYMAAALDIGPTHWITEIEALFDHTVEFGWGRVLNEILGGDGKRANESGLHDFFDVLELLRDSGMEDWWRVDLSIVRGLAYYTGTVFEVIAEGERAVAGGGRYDNLIELFGGPATPACGFGMGDVVLENLLNDHNLMPSGRDLVRALSEPMPVRPDVFVVTNGDAGAEGRLVPVLSALRRGVLAGGGREPWDPSRYRIAPLHARRTYKATTKIGKLKADADAQHARLFVILESDERCTVQDLDGVAEERRDVPIAELNEVAAGMLRA